jgi:poly(3-hydroxybutyrate) depolymerase
MKTRLFISMTCLAALWFAPAFAAERPAGEFPDQKLTVGSAERSYRLVVPRSVDLKRPAPLVFAFHGMGIDSPDLMPVYTRLNDTAAKHKFLLVYPAAQGRSWGLSPEKIKRDLAFFDALLARLQSDYLVDDRRIFVLGMSNGGYFAHLVGKERSASVAAVASHSGPLGLQTLLGINARRKFPVLIIHGDEDALLSVEFARENRDKYKREGHEVKYVEVAGLNHFWASKAEINETIWQFFADHPLEAE